MSMKISFEADVRGFDRVGQAMDKMQKDVNQAAESIEKLMKASNMGGELNLKGAEQIGKVAKEVNSLTQAMGDLGKLQNNLRSVVEIMAKLGGVMGNMGRAEEALGGMQGRSESLKQAVGDRVALNRSSRMEGQMGQIMSGAPHQIPPQLLSSLGAQQNAGVGQAVAQQALGVGAARGGLLAASGIRGAGAAMAAGPLGMAVGGLAVAGVAAYQGVKAAEGAYYMGEKAYYGTELGEVKEFETEMGIARAGTQGRIGRFMGLSRGGTHESQMLAESEDRGGATLFGRRINNKQQVLNRVAGWTSLTFDDNYGKQQNRQRYAALDAPGNEAYDTATQHYIRQQQAQDPLAAGMGSGLSNAAFRRAAFSGVAPMTAATAMPRLQAVEKAGLTEEMLGSKGGLYSSGGLFAAHRRLGLSNEGEASMLNAAVQNPNRGVANMANAMGQFQGGDRMNLASRQAYSSMIAGVQSKFAGREIDPNQFAASGAVVTRSESLSDQGGVYNQLSPMEKVKLGSEAQGFNDRFGSGDIVDLAANQAFMEMGITNPMVRQKLMKLKQAGRHKDAAAVVAKITGKNQGEVEKRMTEGNQAALSNISNLYSQKEMQAFESEAGLDVVGADIYGSDSASATVTGGRSQGEMLFSEKGLHQDATGKKVDTLAKTAGEKVQGAQAFNEQNLMSAVNAIKGGVITAMYDSSKKMVEMLVDEIDKREANTSTDKVEGGG
jgi:hypothetical protein